MGIEELPNKMKAIQVVEFNKPYKINEVDVPKDLQPTDILVKVAVASNCHTDQMGVSPLTQKPRDISPSRVGDGTPSFYHESACRHEPAPVYIACLKKYRMTQY